MRSLPLLAVGAVLCASTLALGQTTQPVAPTTRPVAAATQPSTTRPSATTLPSADSFLPGLGSDGWRARLRAADELVRMGEDARPIIKELLDRPIADVEVRARVEAALAQIDDNRAVGTSFITMHLHDATCKEVFAELSRQCFAELKPIPDNLFDLADLPRVSIDLDRQPFWTAMNTITEKTGVDLQQYNNEGVRLMRGGFRMNSPWSTVQGPFLVLATSLNRTQTEMLVNGGSSSDFSMQLMAYSEPKLHVLNSDSCVKLREVVDDAGNSLIPASPENRGFYGGAGGCWNLYAQLKYPDHPGKKIARFKGSASFVVQTRSQRVEINDVKNLKELTQLIGDMPVVFHELKKVNNTWELRVTTALGPNRWGQFSQSVQTQLKLLDSTGQPLDHRGMRSGVNGAGMEFTILFSASVRADGRSSTDPAKLAWEVPTASKPISVDFEFKDLPMPR